MNSAAEEMIKPTEQKIHGFAFLPLVDDSTLGIKPTQEVNMVNNQATRSYLAASAFDNDNTATFKDREFDNLHHSVFASDLPRRYRAITFSSPEAAAAHREVNKSYLNSPEDLQAYDLAVQGSQGNQGSSNGRQRRGRGNEGGRGTTVTRRPSICYVVDDATLQEAVNNDPGLIFDRIKMMKDEINDLRAELDKEVGARKWTVQQYEVRSLPNLNIANI
jgi:hypothetical protein